MGRNITLAAALLGALVLTVATGTDADQGRSGAGAGPPGRVGQVHGGAASVDPDSFYTPRRMGAGERPPQFVIVSFDGVGSAEKWAYWRAVADRAGMRFTGFLSGVYLVDREHRTSYRGPGHPPGASSLGRWPTAAEVQQLVGDLNAAWARGYEIGTHYNGHFCAGAAPSGNAWSTRDWTDELDQFFRFWTARRDLAIPPATVRGGRTPCLEGRPDQLGPALRAHRFDYDSSRTANGIAWPRKDTWGLWQFPLAYVPLAGTGSGVVSMDYNFWVKQTGNPPSTRDPEAAAAQVLDTYRSMYRAAHDGNRAPLVLGNHFNSWNANAYTQALAAFVTETCHRPETLCVPYRDAIRWMLAQDPAVLAALQARPPVATVG
jgi:hypothetical protein